MTFLRHLSTVVAVLCVFGWMPWLLGVPGQPDTEFGRGWMIGLCAILVYPIAILAIALLSLVLRLFEIRKARLLDAARILTLAAFVAAQALAWSIMI